MQIREGAYYRTRRGDLVGPMRKRDGSNDFPWGYGRDCWTNDGRFSSDINDCYFDLISEVYVSDTPPTVQETEADWRARLLAAGPGPFFEVHDRKTLRDELVEKAALAILTGHYANPGPTSSYGFAEIWLAAEHFVEARKK